MGEIIEALAEQEHLQWVEWSKALAETETLSTERLKRWKALWKPYDKLTEAEKEQDRKYARKILKIIGGN
jgi:hypothetical protein